MAFGSANIKRSVCGSVVPFSEEDCQARYTHTEAPSATPGTTIFAHPLELAIANFILVSYVGFVTCELFNWFDNHM